MFYRSGIPLLEARWFTSSLTVILVTELRARDGSNDVFVHATAVERAGMHGLNEGDKISYDIEEDRQRGKSSAVNLQTK